MPRAGRRNALSSRAQLCESHAVFRALRRACRRGAPTGNGGHNSNTRCMSVRLPRCFQGYTFSALPTGSDGTDMLGAAKYGNVEWMLRLRSASPALVHFRGPVCKAAAARCRVGPESSS